MYNMTKIANESMVGLMQSINSELMLGTFGILILLMISGISFISFYYSTQDVGKAVSGTAFIAFVLSLLLRAMNLIDDIVIFIVLIILGLSVAFLFKSR